MNCHNSGSVSGLPSIFKKLKRDRTLDYDIVIRFNIFPSQLGFESKLKKSYSKRFICKVLLCCSHQLILINDRLYGWEYCYQVQNEPYGRESELIYCKIILYGTISENQFKFNNPPQGNRAKVDYQRKLNLRYTYCTRGSLNCSIPVAVDN